MVQRVRCKGVRRQRRRHQVRHDSRLVVHHRSPRGPDRHHHPHPWCLGKSINYPGKNAEPSRSGRAARAFVGAARAYVGAARAFVFVKASKIQVCAIIKSAIMKQSNMHEFSRAFARKSANACKGCVSPREKTGTTFGVLVGILDKSEIEISCRERNPPSCKCTDVRTFVVPIHPYPWAGPGCPNG